MNTNKKLVEKKIYEAWLPKLEDHYKSKGISVNEAKMKKIAKMCHVRKIYESIGGRAFVNNVNGRGAFSLGNNPANGSDATKGSGEVFQNLFGVFVDSAATTFGMDLLPILTMSKSNLTVFVTEPVYGDGKLNNENKPHVFMVKLDVTGTPTPLVVGTTYTVTEGVGGDDVIDLIYVGKERVKGYATFRVGQSYNNAPGGTNYTEMSILDSLAVAGNGIYINGYDYYEFDTDKLDLVNTYNNFITGYSGAGKNDTNSWFLNRTTGKSGRISEPMSRETGESTYYRSLNLRNWSKNYGAETFHVDIEYTTEFIQDMKMDHDADAIEIGEVAMQDQVSQAMNDHILSKIYGYGWQNHYDMNQASGFNMNAFIGTGTGSAQTFVGKDLATSLTIAGNAGVLPGVGAIAENLSSLQRRLVTRMFFGSAVVGTRARKGKGNTAVVNSTLGTALKDVKGYTAANFDNDLNDNGLSYAGSFYGIGVYEDTLADLGSELVSVFRKGTEKDPGLKLCTYLLAEKIVTIAEGTMAQKEALKSRYVIADVGSYPELNYVSFCIEQDSSYKLV